MKSASLAAVSSPILRSVGQIITRSVTVLYAVYDAYRPAEKINARRSETPTF